MSTDLDSFIKRELDKVKKAISDYFSQCEAMGKLFSGPWLKVGSVNREANFEEAVHPVYPIA